MGRSRGGLITKINLLVYGRRLRVDLAEGHASDCREAEPMVDAVPKGSVCLADEDYDSDAIRARVEDHGGFAYLLAKRYRRNGFPFSAFLYRYRNLVEHFFGKLRRARGLAPRNNKHVHNLLAAIKLLCARRWINANESTA